MDRRMWITVIVIAVVALALITYIKNKRKTEGETVPVGVILPLTGSVAEPGTKALNGLRLAIDTFNETAPRKIQLIIEDSRSDPKSGVSAAQKLISVDKVRVIVGDLMSSVAMAVAPLAERNKVVLFAPGASHPKFPDMGEYMFRNWASDDYDGRVMADYISRTEQLKKGAVIYVNNEYGLGLAEAFRKQFESLGGTIPIFEGYEQGSTDFRPIVAKLQTDNALTFVYLPGQPLENGHIVKQLCEGRIPLKIYANLSVESPEFATIVGEKRAGIIFTSPAFDPETPTAKGATFSRMYTKKYGSGPDVVAGHGYDAGNILVLALKNSNYDLGKLRESLLRIKDFPGVTGSTTFLPNGDVRKDVFVKRLETTGRATLLESFAAQ